MTTTPRRPNILIFMTDQEQGDATLPGSGTETPNADRLAATGVRFTEAYCPAPHCCPSRASLLTGTYPSQHGVYNNVSTPTAIRRGLAAGIPTFSEALRDAGYRLIYTGKWHVSDEEGPADRGWEERDVHANKRASSTRPREWWTDPAITDSSQSGRRERGVLHRPGWGDKRLYGTYQTNGELGYDEAPDWPLVSTGLNALNELAGDSQPWCLFISLNGPHDPFIVPEQFSRRYDPATIDLPASYTDTMDDKPGIYRRQRRLWDQLTESEVREAIASYRAYCTLQDTYLGLVLDALDETGQRDDTLVVRLSDHGEYAGAHGLFCKGVPAFREGSHIPCILSWPGGVTDPNRQVAEFVNIADIAPTLLDAAGIAVPSIMTGRSLLPFLRGEPPTDWPRAAYSQFNGVELYYTQRVVRTAEWTYVYNGFDFDELYDRHADPHETVNLAATGAYDHVIRELARDMWRFAAETGDHLFNSYATVALAPFGPMILNE